MVLVVALLIMAIMSIIGAAAITTSRIDIKISHNTKVSRQAFYFADGGVEQSPKYVRRMIEDGAAPALPNVVMDGTVFNEVMGYTPGPDATDYVHFFQSGNLNAPQNPDVTMNMGTNAVILDVDRDRTAYAAGSGVEFASGAEGAGGASTGGVMVYYTINSVGTGPNNAESYLDVYYRLVVGTAGGK